MKATITIDLDNEDAGDVRHSGPRTIARKLVRYIAGCDVTDSGAIMDTNGNTIGRVEVSNE